MKNITLLMLLLFYSFGLFAEPEYDIVLLAPNGQEDETYPDSQSLTDKGYVLGNRDNHSPPYFYSPEAGFQFIDIADCLDSSSLYMNDNGIIVGNFRTFYANDMSHHIFMFDIHSKSFIDLMDHPDLAGKGGQVIGITNNNKIVIRHYNNDLGALIYDIDTKTISSIKDNVLAVNLKGQMMGGDYSWVTESYTQAWFYDPAIGYIDLGTLDTFGRWRLHPAVLTENGYVAGVGKDTQRDDKGFFWDKENGLIQFEPLSDGDEDEIIVKGANNKGQVVGVSIERIKDGFIEHAFLFDKKLGTVGLGTIGGFSTNANSINDHGQIVGGSVGRSKKKKAKEERAFIWDSTAGMRDLNSLIPSNTGWKRLENATYINNDGYILGEGRYLGSIQAFLLIPKKR